MPTSATLAGASAAASLADMNRAHSSMCAWPPQPDTTQPSAPTDSTGPMDDSSAPFKAFPSQDDGHLLTVLRYVERNALRAGLVGRAEDWRFGSLFAGVNAIGPVVLDTTFQPRDAKWIARVNRPMGEKELAAIRHSIRRGTPFGTKDWASQTAEKLGMESSLRPQGRPGKQEK